MLRLYCRDGTLSTLSKWGAHPRLSSCDHHHLIRRRVRERRVPSASEQPTMLDAQCVGNTSRLSVPQRTHQTIIRSWAALAFDMTTHVGPSLGVSLQSVKSPSSPGCRLLVLARLDYLHLRALEWLLRSPNTVPWKVGLIAPPPPRSRQ